MGVVTGTMMGTLNREHSDQAPAVGCTQGNFLENLMPSLSLKRMCRNLSSDEESDSGKGRGSHIVCCLWDRVQSSGTLEDRVGVGGQVREAAR